MSERERWIVYPLLFLALGTALRDKLFDLTTSKRIVCQELTVVDEPPVGREPVVLARIGRMDPSATGAPTGGYLVVNGQLSVTGTVDAQNYAIRGIPLVPTWRAIMSPADFLRALQQSAQALQNAKPPDGNPPRGEPADNNLPATESNSGDEPSAVEPPQ